MIEQFLEKAVQLNASDIFMITGMPFSVKVNGLIQHLNEEKIFPETMEEYIKEIYELSGNRSMERVLTHGDDDFSFAIPGLSRFRISVLKQRGSLGAVIRVVRFTLPNPSDLHIPDSVIEIANMRKGFVLITGAAGASQGMLSMNACLQNLCNQGLISEEVRQKYSLTQQQPTPFFYYPLIPPPVTPAMIFSDKKIYNKRVGKNTITTAANNPPQSPVYCIAVSTLLSPGPTGIFSEEEAKIKEIKYSFQIFIKLKIATVISPGCARGNIIFQNVFIGEQPSIAAASSYVLERFLKNVIKNVVVYGICIPIYNKINTIREPVK